MKRHSWIWHRPKYGLRQCQQCGRIENIQNHRKVGDCKGRICDKCGGSGYIREVKK